MRIYERATVTELVQTGFQSACTEFAEKPLSLDERFSIGNPGIFTIVCQIDDFRIGINKGDLLVVDQSLRPRKGDLIVTQESVFKFNHPANLEGVEIRGVVKALLKNTLLV